MTCICLSDCVINLLYIILMQCQPNKSLIFRFIDCHNFFTLQMLYDGSINIFPPSIAVNRDYNITHELLRGVKTRQLILHFKN